MQTAKTLSIVSLLVALCASCAMSPGVRPSEAGGSGAGEAAEPGLRLPPGFRATVFAEGVGPARHLVVRDDGTVYVALRAVVGGGSVVALRDLNRDGRADRMLRFGEAGGTGIAIHDGALYFSSDVAVFRVPLSADGPGPSGPIETVVSGFPDQRGHRAKSLALDDEGCLYVNVGAPSNACQRKRRTRGSPGVPDCPQLEWQSGVWRFPANQSNLTQQSDGERFATGLRNSVALTWNPLAKQIFVVQHGRDQLRKFWREFYTAEESADLPAEELHALELGSNAGWPYTYWDGPRAARMVAPEYGGDGKLEAEPGRYQEPLLAFPAHWGPNAIVFHNGNGLPDRYRGGAFIAFHGSWNRSPLAQGGYNVVFAPFAGGRPVGSWEVFADGFAGVDPIAQPSDATYRPTGVAQGPDGALYVADSQKGRIWRITWEEPTG